MILPLIDQLLTAACFDLEPAAIADRHCSRWKVRARDHERYQRKLARIGGRNVA